MMIARIIEKGLLKAGRILFIRCLLPDRPGELTGVLKTISDLEGNIREISVSRLSPQAPLNQAVLELTVETKGCEHSREILQCLKRSGIKLL